jgi:hypothetical protein
VFHAHDNVCFERTGTGETYGSVRICRLRPGEEMGPGAGETILVCTAEEWSSIASSMTALGENSQTYGMMLALMR